MDPGEGTSKRRAYGDRESVLLSLADLAQYDYSSLNRLYDLPDSSESDSDHDDETVDFSTPAEGRMMSLLKEKERSEELVRHEQPVEPVSSPTVNNEPTVSTTSKSKKSIRAGRQTLWYANRDNDLLSVPPEFQGEHKSRVVGIQPIDYFLEMVKPEFMTNIVWESNLYATQKGKTLNLTENELKVFLGINFMMTYIKYSRLNQYWSPLHGTRMEVIAKHMSCNRFREIRRYIHFVDNLSEEPSNIKLKKIWSFISHLKENFLAAVSPERNLSIDEMMVPFKGRSSMKQYIKSKPHKWGFKIWVIAGATGYVYDFEIYQGSTYTEQVVDEQMGVVANVVLRLASHFQSKNHCIYFDNLFTTIPLLVKLREMGIYATGTIRSNRLQGAEKKVET